MKRKTLIISSMLIACIIGAGIFFHINQESEQIVNAQTGISQHNIADTITKDLKQQGITVKSSRFVNDSRLNPPILLDFVVQSISSDNKVAPDDPIYSNIINRAVNLAHRQGLNVGGFGLTLINSKGQAIYKKISSLNKAEISSQLDPPLRMNKHTVDNLIRYNIPIHGLTLSNLKVSEDKYGFRDVSLNLQAIDVESANKVIASIIGDFRLKIQNLNAMNGCQISSYNIDLTSASGDLLLKYVNDQLLRHENWWQSEKLSEDWFPKPPQRVQN